MLISDLPGVDVVVDVGASPASVWELVADINTPALFSSEFLRAEWVDASAPLVGSQFRGHNRRGEFEWSTLCTAVEFEPPRVFAWAVEYLDAPVATWTFEVESQGNGTSLRMRARLGPGRSGLTMAVEANPEKEHRIVERRMQEWRHNMTATIEGIKGLVER